VLGYALSRHFAGKKGEGFSEASASSSAVKHRFVSASPEQAEMKKIDTTEYLYDYIVHVINHGSNQLGFPGGEMEGGYIDDAQAKVVACYVLELSGRKCPHAYPKEAAMYFTSVCGGCHGNDGKGIHGSYPDLTREELLGIKMKKESLRRQLRRKNRPDAGDIPPAQEKSG